MYAIKQPINDSATDRSHQLKIVSRFELEILFEALYNWYTKKWLSTLFFSAYFKSLTTDLSHKDTEYKPLQAP